MSDDFNIHPAARDEFHAALHHYAAVDETGALVAAFAARFWHYTEIIVANPLLYHLRRGPVRRVNLTPRFGETYIAYMIWREKVVILAVAHAKRRPYYWRRRIAEAREIF